MHQVARYSKTGVRVQLCVCVCLCVSGGGRGGDYAISCHVPSYY